MAGKDEAPKKIKRPTALKRNIQNVKRAQINGAFKSRLRTAVRRLELELRQEGQEDKLKERLSNVYALTDKGVKRGILSLNKASRIKKRFAHQVRRKATA